MWFNDWLDVKRSGSGLELYLSFRKNDEPTLSLGPIITPYPTVARLPNTSIPGGVPERRVFHTYPTEKLPEAEAMALYEELRGILGEEHVRLVGTSEVYDEIMRAHKIPPLKEPGRHLVVQAFDIPHERYDSLPKHLRRQLIKGKYRLQARRQLGFPVREAEIHPGLEGLARPLKDINDLLYDIANDPKRERRDEWAHATSQATSLSAQLKRADPEAEVIINEKTRQANIRLPSLRLIEYQPTHLRPERIISLPMRFVDTEQKYYAYKHRANCFIGMMDGSTGRRIDGIILTTEEYAKSAIDSSFQGTDVRSEIVLCQTELELVARAGKAFKNDNPPITIAQHIKHDMMELRGIKLRESHKGFPVGLDRAEPRKSVALDFFTRMECPGRIFLDTMRIAMILDPHLPAYNLEAITGLEKIISYQDFDRLCRQGDPDGLRHRYLALDIHSMTYHVLEGPWKRRLALIPTAAIHLGASITEAAFSPSCAKSYLDWQHLQDHGTYRVTPKQQARIVKAEKKFRERWRKDLLDEALVNISHPRGRRAEQTPDGVYDVQRAYIPLGKEMMHKLSINLPDFTMHRMWDRLDHIDRIALCQYLNALTYEPWLHIGMTRDYKRRAESEARTAGMDISMLRQGDANFWRRYKENSKDNATAAARNLQLIKTACSHTVSYHLAIKAFASAYKARAARSRFFFRHNFSQEEWMEHARAYAQRAGAAIADAKGRVVAREGLWIYLDGQLSDGWDRGIVPLDRVRILKITKNGMAKAIFKERGTYHGIKINPEKPTQKTIFESRTLNDILDAIIEGDIIKTRKIHDENLAALAKGNIPARELLFKPKKKHKEDAEEIEDADEVRPDDKTGTAHPDLGKEEHSFRGMMDGREEVFHYHEYENGLERFQPDLDAYIARYRSKVGYWMRKGIKALKEQKIGKQGRLF